MRFATALAWLLLAAIPASSLAAKRPAATSLPNPRFTLPALLPVDESGQPGEIRFAGELPAGLDELVARRLASLRFEPARRDGQPVASELAMKVSIELVRDADATEIKLLDLSPEPLVLPPPRYPGQAARDNRSAAVMLLVELSHGDEGQRVDVQVLGSEVRPGPQSRYAESFEESALKAAQACCKLVETIGGQPWPQVFQVPIVFYLDWTDKHVDMDAFKARWPEPASRLPAGLARATVLEASSQAP